LLALRDGEVRWRFDFAPGTGGASNLLESARGLYLGRGNSVLRLSEDGAVQDRWLVSGEVSELAFRDNLMITVTHAGALSERFELQGEVLSPTPRFGLDLALYHWLEREGGAFDPGSRLLQDSTNPWVHLALGKQLQEGGEENYLERYREAIATGRTFYDLAGLSRALFAEGETHLAGEAFEAALEDFAARAYTPVLLSDPRLIEAYNFALQPLGDALRRGDLEAAGFWAPRLWRSSPNAEGAPALYRRYAAALAGAGRHDEAQLWRARARSGLRQVAGAGLEGVMSALGRSGWYAALAMLIAILALQLTLFFKYWPAQRRDLRGKAAPGGARMLRLLGFRYYTLRYYTLTEKLVLVLIFTFALGLAALAGWAQSSRDLPLALRSGTLASAEAERALETLSLQGPVGSFIRGYAAHTAGREGEAAAYYRQAGDYAPALYNLALLENDGAFFELSPGLPGVQPVVISPWRYETGLPLIAPGPQDFVTAQGTGWAEALGRSFTNPWLGVAAPPNLSPLLWTVLLTLFVLVALFHVLFVFVPRPHGTRPHGTGNTVDRAPPSPGYYVLALLIPGSGLADEAWGFLLIAPWAALVLELAAEPFGFGRQETVMALLFLYLINVAILAVDYLMRRRQLAADERQAPSRSHPILKKTG
jgi:hypothetical protein